MPLASRHFGRETAGIILNQQLALRSCVNPAGAEPLDHFQRSALNIIIVHDRIAYGLGLKTRLTGRHRRTAIRDFIEAETAIADLVRLLGPLPGASSALPYRRTGRTSNATATGTQQRLRRP
jgi:hypothetical protein